MARAADDEGSALSIRSVAVGNNITLVVGGELDISTVGDLRAAIDDAFESPGWTITVNVDGITTIDSMGLREFLLAYRRSRETARPILFVFSPTHQLLFILKQLGLIEHLPIQLAEDETATE